MYIPPHFKRRTGQLFLLGVFTGAVISYALFAYMHGRMYEDLLADHLALQAEVTELTDQNQALLQDKQDLSEKSKEHVTVQSIDISFLNPKELKLDRLMIHQLNEIIRREIGHIIGQDIATLSENDQLLVSTIENKIITLDEFTYRFEVTKLTIAQKVRMTLSVKLAP